MFRYAFELIGLLILFSVARTVITWVLRLLAGSVQMASAPREQAGSTETLQSAGELQKDPVCGTFVPVASSLKRMVAGHPVYFCSPECRDRF
ncbi:MAG: hypothetical protein JWO80_52 [Bryobacterales bacterium]|jgi:hypothetical protein|nr:hypothetical protein [Bryobacterales bacterium]